MQMVAHKKSSSTKFIFVHLLQIVQELRSRWLEATNRVSFSGKKALKNIFFTRIRRFFDKVARRVL
jgi:hypothetical protein